MIIFITSLYYWRELHECVKIIFGFRFFSPSCSFNFHYFMLAFFLCFFVLFKSYCSHAQVFGRTLVHEVDIFYSHGCIQIELYFFVFLGSTLFGLRSSIKQNTIICFIKRAASVPPSVRESQLFTNWIRKKMIRKCEWKWDK